MSAAGNPWEDFKPGGSFTAPGMQASGPWSDFSPPPPSPKPEPVSTWGSLARNAASGFVEGLESMPAAALDAVNPVSHVENLVRDFTTNPFDINAVQRTQQADNASFTAAGDYLTGKINQGLDYFGLDPTKVQPSTWDERLAHNIGTGASAVALPIGEAGLLTNAARGLVTGAASGAGADIAEEAVPDQYKPLAGTAGAIVGGLGAAHTMAGTILPKFAREIGTGTIGMTTGAGGDAISQAYQAGRAGGNLSAALTDAMRGRVPVQSVVDDARTALANLRAARNAEYRSGMLDVSNDQSVLDFKPIDDSLQKVLSVKTFKGQDLSPNTANVRSQIQDTVDRWRSLDPTQYHTPEGIDALKQQIGDIRDAQPFGTPQRLIADQVYGAVRGTIAKQAPIYDQVMRDYSSASDQISQIERELSLGPKGNPNTALRKLQSIMRNNAATGWGSRASLVNTLAANGADTLPAKIAGQALSQWEPRGIARLGGIGDIGIAAATHNPASLAMLPAFSPRVMGEAAHGLGSLVRMMNVRNPNLVGGVASVPSLASILSRGAP